MRYGLVGCVKSKGPEAAPAGELYVSPLFAGRRRWVEETCDHWAILSALHGFVLPDRVLEPYELALADLSAAGRDMWGRFVEGDLRAAWPSAGAGDVVELHAGEPYFRAVVPALRRLGLELEWPVEGLMIGEQLSLYKRGPRAHPIRRPMSPEPSARRRPTRLR